jgi:hypothetical protein
MGTVNFPLRSVYWSFGASGVGAGAGLGKGSRGENAELG